MPASRRAHGSLESAVLRLLQRATGPWTSRDVRVALEADGDVLAQTTVLTVLSRLEKKGLVERDPASRTFRAMHADPGESAVSMAQVLDRSDDRAAVLQRFTGSLGADDLAALRAALGADVALGADAALGADVALGDR